MLQKWKSKRQNNCFSYKNLNQWKSQHENGVNQLQWCIYRGAQVCAPVFAFITRVQKIKLILLFKSWGIQSLLSGTTALVQIKTDNKLWIPQTFKSKINLIFCTPLIMVNKSAHACAPLQMHHCNWFTPFAYWDFDWLRFYNWSSYPSLLFFFSVTDL
jgi:hypothetical protein